MLRLWLVCCLIPFVCGGSGEYSEFKKIYHGKGADIRTVPYQVAVYNHHWVHVCGGVILEPTVILTAAHCVNKFARSFIQYGVTELTDKRNFIQSDKIVVHENYVLKYPEYPKFDIALIFLKRPIIFSAYAQPVILPTQPPATGTLCVVSGWGKTENGKSPNHLRKVEIKMLDHKKCKKLQYYQGLEEYMVCAGLFEGQKDSCKGDSGGPLVGFNMELIGIVSWGNGCGLENNPGVYTNVYFFLDWIRYEIQKKTNGWNSVTSQKK